MPYVHISISRALTDEQIESVRDAVASRMSLIPGKTRNNAMLHIEAGQHLTMGDDGLPCVFLEARLFTASPWTAKAAFAESVSAVLAELTETPAERIFMNFIELDHWTVGSRVLRAPSE